MPKERGLMPASSTAAFAVLACTLAVAGPAAAEDVRFTSAPDVTFNALSGPRSIAVGDFDNDGKQDFAVADFSRDSVRVRLGNGDGTFRTVATVGPFVRPEDVVGGDFDGDGNEDLAIAAEVPGNHQVAVLAGDGEGSFTPLSTLDVPKRAASLAVADLNGDGREDLAITSYLHLSVRLGQAGGGIASAGYDIEYAAAPEEVVAGDFNGDGKEDVAVLLGGDPHRVAVLSGAGDGTFAVVDVSILPDFANALAIGDFNEDGRNDTAASLLLAQRVSIRLGNGDATLSDTPPDVRVSDDAEGVAVGDFDSDRHEALAIPRGDGDRSGLSIRLGDGQGGFTSGGQVAVGNGPSAVAVGDFDADGKEDLLVSNRRS